MDGSCSRISRRPFDPRRPQSYCEESNRPTVGAGEFAAEKTRLEMRSKRQQADKNLYFRLRLGQGVDGAAVIDALNAIDIVEIAYAAPAPPPPAAGLTASLSGDFTAEQTYAFAAPYGIDAAYARTLPGGTGLRVTIADIEFSWNQDHEDLSAARMPNALLVPEGWTPLDPWSDPDHGTAVIGMLAADDNGFGVTGLAPDANLRLVPCNYAGIWDPSDPVGYYELGIAIDTAASQLGPGDVLLVEQQAFGPNWTGEGDYGAVPSEWYPAYYDAIVAATSAGVIVVEAAGNGWQDLDDASVYGSPFPAGRADSGAIIVGAGGGLPGGMWDADPLERCWFSSYGSRVNLQGWGEQVVTTGYGTRQGGSDPNTWYHDDFQGTSSASPMVAAAAAILSSIAQERGDLDGLSSVEVRSILVTTGTPQATGPGMEPGHIGPQPNLRTALSAEPGPFPDVPSTHPYSAAIADMAGRGVVGGYTDGLFGPDDPVARQQFAKMIVRGLELPVSESLVCPFTDVGSGLSPSDPLYPDKYVAVCAAHNITTGVTPTSFEPYAQMSRAQLITMVARAANLVEPPVGYDPPFGVFSTTHFPWARRAAHAGLLDGLVGMGRTYDFWRQATRGEVCQVLHNLLTVR